MAVTTFKTDDAHAIKIWEKKLAVEVSKATPIAPLIGKDQDSIIQLKDLGTKGTGDRITFGLRTQLMGDGVSEGDTLEGNEESLQFLNDSLVINSLRHAVRNKSESTIEDQRIAFDLMKESHAALKDWYADRLSLMAFIQFCGFTANKMSFEGRSINIKPVHYGFNDPMSPSGLRVVRAGGKSTDEELVEEDVFNLTLIDKAVERAKLANPMIRPIRVDGDKYYVMYLHSTQVTSLRTNTAEGQWLDIQKAAYSGSRAKNPIFDGSLGVYNGVVLREAQHVTEGVATADPTAAVPNTRRAVLLGAQAGMIAFGRDTGANRYKLIKEKFDYENETGVSATTILGMKKTRYKDPDGGQMQDFGTIVIPTFAKPA